MAYETSEEKNMCFRPAMAEPTLECPACGKTVKVVMGVVPEECPFCDAGLGDAAAAINNAASGVPAAPAAPKAPSAPVAPR